MDDRTVMIIPAGAIGVDFSFARPPVAVLKREGYKFVVRYLSVPPSDPAKNASKGECESYIKAGLGVLLVWEMSATTPDQGAPRGQVDGSTACRLARGLGYPENVPILTAVDTNTVASNMAAHEAYVRAFATACLPYPCGVYGDLDIWQRVRDRCVIGWIPNARAWSGTTTFAQLKAKATSSGAHVLQSTGYWIDGKWAVDPNETLRPIPAWGNAATTPIEGDDDMKVFIKSETNDHPDGPGAIWEAALGGRIHVGEWYFNSFQEAQQKNPSVKVFDLILMSNDEINAIPSVPVGGNAGDGGFPKHYAGNVVSIPGPIILTAE